VIVRRHQAPTLIGCELLKIASRQGPHAGENRSTATTLSRLPLAAAEKRDYAAYLSLRQHLFRSHLKQLTPSTLASLAFATGNGADSTSFANEDANSRRASGI
ncbi:hypothetical protein, partial [Paraburkholderia sp. 2C]